MSLGALAAEGLAGARLLADLPRVLEVERRPPEPTAAGRILHLHLGRPRRT